MSWKEIFCWFGWRLWVNWSSILNETRVIEWLVNMKLSHRKSKKENISLLKSRRFKSNEDLSNEQELNGMILVLLLGRLIKCLIQRNSDATWLLVDLNRHWLQTMMMKGMETNPIRIDNYHKFFVLSTYLIRANVERRMWTLWLQIH